MLWCVNITGPDDVIAVSGRREAVAMSDRFNRVMVDRFEPVATENDPLCWAVPSEWPHDEASHAENLGDFGEYSWLRGEAA